MPCSVLVSTVAPTLVTEKGTLQKSTQERQLPPETTPTSDMPQLFREAKNLAWPPVPQALAC